MGKEVSPTIKVLEEASKTLAEPVERHPLTYCIEAFNGKADVTRISRFLDRLKDLSVNKLEFGIEIQDVQNDADQESDYSNEAEDGSGKQKKFCVVGDDISWGAHLFSTH